MSVATETIYDVFLSHGAQDKGLAQIVTRALDREGLEVFAVHEVTPGEEFLAKMRRELAQCSAFVLILTRSTLKSPNIAFEIGMAMAWNKPIYVLYDGITKKEIPGYLKEFNVLQVSKLPQVVREIAQSQQPFSEEDRDSLINVYQELGVPTDQLLGKPAALHELSQRYNDIASSHVSGERLVQELIRLRKQGKLPKMKRN